MKTPVLSNLFKLFRFAHQIFTGSLPLGVKNEENMTIVLFFSLSHYPQWKTARKCDGKSKKLE